MHPTAAAATAPPVLSRPAPRRSPLRALVTAYGVAATAALVLVAALGDRTAVSYAVALSAFWWLLPAPVLLLAALVLRGRRAAAAVLTPAVAAAWLLGPYAVPWRGGGEHDLRVAVYNTSGPRGVEGLRALLATWEPDVVLLQEVTTRTARELAGEFPEYPHRRLGRLSGDEWSDASAVWSRTPLTGVVPVDGLPAGARPAEVVTVAVGGREVDVVSLHLASPCLTCAGEQVERNPAGGTAAAARTRVAEAQRLVEVVRERRAAGRAVVLGGDLNSSDLNQPLRVLTGGGLVDVHRAVGDRPQLTRGPGPGAARVDVVLVAGLEPVADAEGWRGASDHSPVIADLAHPS
ncbi:endonuclease/exonuclease/phosphatase family protein [Kineococcus terrestris]|uniref:endonuclease/exonuclease/phosphatase family protein n=1 Tax=Kineococcus terrestris TaxID=2044856 RepID=UPI0034DB7994